MTFPDMMEFNAVLTRLKLAIEPIMARRRSGGEQLTWRPH